MIDSEKSDRVYEIVSFTGLLDPNMGHMEEAIRLIQEQLDATNERLESNES